MRWFLGAWLQGSLMIRTFFTFIFKVLSKWQAWLFVFLLSIIIIRTPLFREKLLELEYWNNTVCNFSVGDVYVLSPTKIAPNDTGTLYVTYRNTLDTAVGDVNIALLNKSGEILFPESNAIRYSEVFPGQIVTEELDFLVIDKSNVQDAELEVSLFQDVANTVYCENKIILRVDFWRKIYVNINSVPKKLEYVLNFLGFLSTLLAGILAFRGKIPEIFKSLESRNE